MSHQHKPEPFGYFKAEPFGWTDCAENDDGAVPLYGKSTIDALIQQRDTAWAQAHRLALELECLLLDTKDNAVMSKWWDSGMAALSEYQELQPGAKEEAEAWAAMRKAGI